MFSGFFFFYVKTGSGKTRTAFEEFPKIYTPLSYKWWEGYEGQTEVLIDDFRKDWCKFHELLKLLDRYPFKVEAKGSHHQLMATHHHYNSTISTTVYVRHTRGHRAAVKKN